MRTVKVSHEYSQCFQTSVRKTVISIVLQILKAIIGDGDHLDSRRCLMLDGSLIFFFFFTTIPPTTRYYSVRIFIPGHIICTTTTLNKTKMLPLKYCLFIHLLM